MSLSKILSDRNRNEFVQSYVDAMLFVMHGHHPIDQDSMVPFDECLIDNSSIQNAKRIAERVLNEILNTMDKTCLDIAHFNRLIDWSQLGHDAALEYDITCTSAFDSLEEYEEQSHHVETLKDVLNRYDWTVNCWVNDYWIEECGNGCDGQLRAVIA